MVEIIINQIFSKNAPRDVAKMLQLIKQSK